MPPNLRCFLSNYFDHLFAVTVSAYYMPCHMLVVVGCFPCWTRSMLRVKASKQFWPIRRCCVCLGLSTWSSLWKSRSYISVSRELQALCGHLMPLQVHVCNGLTCPASHIGTGQTSGYVVKTNIMPKHSLQIHKIGVWRSSNLNVVKIRQFSHIRIFRKSLGCTETIFGWIRIWFCFKN